MICRKCKKEVPDAPFCGLCGAQQVQNRKPLKRPNGAGSVYKLAGRRRRPWIAAVVKGHDKDTGQPNRIILGYYERKTDAIEALTPSAIEAASAYYNYTLVQAYEAWKEKPSYLKLSKSMKDNYSSAWKHFNELHNSKIRFLRPTDYQEAINAQADEGKSASTLQKMKGLISKLCMWAMEHDVINKNYAQFLEIDDDEFTEKEIFSDKDISKLIEHKDDRVAKIILALIFTGLRPGELAKVCKDDSLNLKEHYLINGSKTSAGKNRIIPLVDFIYPIFVEAAMAASPNAPLFTSPNSNSPLSPTNFRIREFYPYLDQLKIMENPYDEDGKRKPEVVSKFTPYTCRHTFASLSNRAGVKKAVLQKAIGHVVGSNITDAVYIHEQNSEYKTEFSKLDLLATVLATSRN